MDGVWRNDRPYLGALELPRVLFPADPPKDMARHEQTERSDLHKGHKRPHLGPYKERVTRIHQREVKKLLGMLLISHYEDIDLIRLRSFYFDFLREAPLMGKLAFSAPSWPSKSDLLISSPPISCASLFSVPWVYLINCLFSV